MINKDRCYFVIDMKSFYASVECAERGLDAITTKLVVADNKRTVSTICLAVSPALKNLGIKNRCRLFEIPKNIDFIIAKPRMKKYIEYTSKIYYIFLNYISKDDIHVYSIDESFIDVTDYLKIYKTDAFSFAKKLMTEIETKLKIPSTVGIGTNLYLAKIALDITAKNNPNRIGFLNEELFKKQLWYHTPLQDFWGISDGITNRLKKFGIENMYDIAHCKEDLLFKEFGINAEFLIDHSWGIETCLMSDIKNYKGKSKSISSSQILPFNYSTSDAFIVFKEMLHECCYSLVKNNLLAKNIHIFIGYHDHTTSKMSKTFRFSVNLFSQIFPYANNIFNNIVNKNKLIRKLGISFGSLTIDNIEQFDFFTDLEQINKESRVTKTVLKIKEKYGKNAILRGSDFLPNATQKIRNTQIGGHNSGENENA